MPDVRQIFTIEAISSLFGWRFWDCLPLEQSRIALRLATL
jgi:hypothetical protein